VDQPTFELLNRSQYFFLREISEPHDNSLRLVMQEAVVNSSSVVRPRAGELPEVTRLREGAAPIESVEGCKTYELYWNRYAAYLVTNESVASCGNHPNEEYSGNLFRKYTKSNFLKHLEQDAQAIIEPVQHFKLICLNHVIDVASYEAPQIRKIEKINLS
jgi:hypothetical protein